MSLSALFHRCQPALRQAPLPMRRYRTSDLLVKARKNEDGTWARGAQRVKGEPKGVGAVDGEGGAFWMFCLVKRRF